MKKIIFLLAVCLIPVLLRGQMNTGIQFQEADSWKSVLELAKKSQKNIFVDAYTTWCGPCKKMDREVYTDQNVAKYVNQNFIAVKVQFDQTNKDPSAIRNWYDDAKYLLEKYHIEAFPTFLFVSAEGELLQKDIGYRNPVQFLEVLRNAIDPGYNYYGQLQQFNLGKVTGKKLLSLALAAKRNQDDSISLQIAKMYKKEVLDRTEPSKTISSGLADFMTYFQQLFSLKDNIIKYLYQHQLEADKILGQQNFSMRFTDYLISKELVDSFISKAQGNLPDWDILKKKIASVYDRSTAERAILNAKLDWYTNKKDWPNIVKYNIERLESQKIDTVGIAKSGINNMVYNVIFKHSMDAKSLEKGISYMELILKNNPDTDSWLDTYANLLYKAGRKEEAIRQEEKALKIASSRNDSSRVSIYKKVIEKMKNSLPTWE